MRFKYGGPSWPKDQKAAMASRLKWRDEVIARYRAELKQAQAEITALRQAVKDALEQLQEHAREYHHQTPAELLRRLKQLTR